MKLKEAIDKASRSLKEITDIPRKEAMILASFVLKKDISYILLNEEKEFEVSSDFFALIDRRAKGEPLEYITKSVSFYSREFFIDRGALIPRPETELLIDEVLKNHNYIGKKYLNIAEIGVGSGVISIMLALKLKDARIIATDISKDALKIAKKNIDKFNLQDRVELLLGAYLDGVEREIDIIVSNPPYVADDFKIDKPLKYEPKEAIFGGKRGDEVLAEIILLFKKSRAKLLCCEMGYNQKESIIEILKDYNFDNFYFYKDLAGLDRGFIVKN